jgi:hypothetical protein
MVKLTMMLVAFATVFAFSKDVPKNTSKSKDASKKVQQAVEQSSEAPKFGVRLGANIYDYSTGNKALDKKIDLGWGFGGGLVMEIFILPYASFNPELNFFYRKMYNQGGDFEGVDPVDGAYFENRNIGLSEFAVSIPLMFRLKPAVNIPFYLAAGTQLDIPVSSEMYHKSKKTYASGDKTTRMTEDNKFKNRGAFDFGIALGLGFEVLPELMVDFRCVIGMTGITDGEHTTKDEQGQEIEFEDKSSFNQFGLGVTYYF